VVQHKVIDGGVTSTVSCNSLSALTVLPQGSRSTVSSGCLFLYQPNKIVTSLTKVTVEYRHASVAVTVVTSGAGTVWLQVEPVVQHKDRGGVTSTVLVNSIECIEQYCRK
jgi:hypothetical protein